jgi:hypothetical protein
VGLIDQIQPAGEIVHEIAREFHAALAGLSSRYQEQDQQR